MSKSRYGKGARTKTKIVRKKAEKTTKSAEEENCSAAQHLAAKRYKDAITTFKRLLNKEDHSAWRTGLTEAYLGRAQQLANKGMCKEAVVLWENMAQRATEPPRVDLYMFWLLGAGFSERAAQEYMDRGTPNRQLSAVVAAYLLVDPILQAKLPINTSPQRHFSQAMAAIDAYCEGRDDDLFRILKAIPFRSPFRDLRWILQALVSGDQTVASSLLAKVAKDSPFHRFAYLAELRNTPVQSLFSKLPQIAPTDQSAALGLFGLKADQRRFTLELLKLAPKDPKLHFDFVLKNRNILGQNRTREFCYTLLPQYPRKISSFCKELGVLPPFDRYRLEALAMDHQQHDAVDDSPWENCLALLDKKRIDKLWTLLPITFSQAHKVASILCLHLASYTEQAFDPDDEDILVFLEKAVQYDSESKEAWLALLGWLFQHGNQKVYNRNLEQAVRHFPKDTDILESAAKCAYGRGVYKKAANYAERVLAENPIDKDARQMLVSSHLAHAQKQMCSNKLELAKRQLQQVEQLCRDQRQKVAVLRHQGFLKLLEQESIEALQLLQQAHIQDRGGLTADFHFYMTGLKLEIKLPKLSNYLQEIVEVNHSEHPGKSLSSQSRVLDKGDVLAFIDLCDRFFADKKNQERVSVVLQQLCKPLAKAPTLEYSKAEMDSILMSLHRLNALSLLAKFTAQAKKRWGQSPLYTFCTLYAQAQGKAKRLSRKDRSILFQASCQAMDNDDRAIAQLINKFTGIMGLPFHSLPGGFPEGLDVLRELFERFDDDDEDDFFPPPRRCR